MYKIVIDRDFSMRQLKLFVISTCQVGGGVMKADGGFTPITPGVRFEPTLTLPDDDEMLPLLLEAILARGVRPKEQSKVEGLLEATKAHLEDMRRLVFEPKDTIELAGPGIVRREI